MNGGSALSEPITVRMSSQIHLSIRAWREAAIRKHNQYYQDVLTNGNATRGTGFKDEISLLQNASELSASNHEKSAEQLKRK